MLKCFIGIVSISTVVVVLSSALISAIPTSADEQIIMQNKNLRLLVTATDATPKWADPELLMEQEVKFMDITDHPNMEDDAKDTRDRTSNFPIPQHLSHGNLVIDLISQIDTDRMKTRLTKFTTFTNRYYKSKTGAASSDWLKQTLLDIIADTAADATLTTFKHSWSQNSLIVRFNSVVNNVDTPIVIVGSHQDTVRGGFFEDSRAPGADDDGSGSMTSLEAFTLICESGMKPHFPLEFHFYSAEEAGLLGSQDVAAKYQKEKKNILGMLQFDMTGYGKKNVYGIVTDYTDPDLTSFLRKLAATYGGIEMVDTRCNYACSDHASWNRAGYRSAFPFEGEFKDSSPYIHKSLDTIDHVNFDHMKEFVKVALGFAVELSSDSS